MKVSIIPPPTRIIWVKKIANILIIVIMSVFLLSTTGSEVELSQPLPEVTVDSGGKANVSVSIEVVQASVGPTPVISLNYNPDAGNGPIGIKGEIGETTYVESPGLPHKQCFRKKRYTGNYPYEEPILCEDVEY
ncbi:MAG: hypothetical protein H7A23_03370 [Leptospiraceae bacterium]|nr:hypothetical protein [Leptospiraceae bacterium]